jgi:hypothetical protein
MIAGMTPQANEAPLLAHPYATEDSNPMTEKDGWDKFLGLSDADKDAVRGSLDAFLHLPMAKAHRFSETEWGAVTDLSKATKERWRPSDSVLQYLPDFLPGGNRFQTRRKDHNS